MSNNKPILVYLSDGPDLYIPDFEICIGVCESTQYIQTVKDLLIYVKSKQSRYRPFDGYILPHHSFDTKLEIETLYQVFVIPCEKLMEAVYKDMVTCLNPQKQADPMFETSFSLLKYFCFIEPVKCPPMIRYSPHFQNLFRHFIRLHHFHETYETYDTSDMFSAFLLFYNQVQLINQ